MSELIISGHDSGGRRDFLEGKPLHCGTVVEYHWDFAPARWLLARYEMDSRGGYLILDDDTTVGIDQPNAPMCRRHKLHAASNAGR